MMDAVPANIDVLKSDLADSISRLTEYRKDNKRKADRVVIWGAAISGSTTVAIGLGGLIADYSVYFQAIALLLSASLTVLTAWDGLYNHKRLWNIQASVLNELFQIQTDIRHLEASGAVEQPTVDALYHRYKSAFDEYHAQWQEMRVAHKPAE
jgi:hypothetical protein